MGRVVVSVPWLKLELVVEPLHDSRVAWSEIVVILKDKCQLPEHMLGCMRPR